MHTEQAVIETPIGLLGLEAERGALVRIRFQHPGPAVPPCTALLEEAARQIGEYFAGRRARFSLPLRRPESATAFQNRVWDAMLRIPIGETRTYGDLAAELKTSPRAVGGACGRNPLPLVIPCHRVVARGGLGGFSGEWETGIALDVKAVLLEHESRVARAAERETERAAQPGGPR